MITTNFYCDFCAKATEEPLTVADRMGALIDGGIYQNKNCKMNLSNRHFCSIECLTDYIFNNWEK